MRILYNWHSARTVNLPTVTEMGEIYDSLPRSPYGFFFGRVTDNPWHKRAYRKMTWIP